MKFWKEKKRKRKTQLNTIRIFIVPDGQEYQMLNCMRMKISIKGILIGGRRRRKIKKTVGT